MALAPLNLRKDESHCISLYISYFDFIFRSFLSVAKMYVGYETKMMSNVADHCGLITIEA